VTRAFVVGVDAATVVARRRAALDHVAVSPAASRRASVRPAGTSGGNHRDIRRADLIDVGEKGIAILAPIVGRKEADVADGDTKTVVGFRAAYLFDGLSRDSRRE